MAQGAAFDLQSPVHPGHYVKIEILEPLALSVTAAAEALGITRAALSTFLNERSDLSPEMALRIEKAFGVSLDRLMRMQSDFDIALARKREGEINVARYVPKERAAQQTSMF